MSESAVPGLKAAMKRAGYTQKSLAEKMGLAVSTVARWSNGEMEPSISTVRKVADILGSSLAELLGISVRDEQRGCSIVRVKSEPGKKTITIEVKEESGE